MVARQPQPPTRFRAASLWRALGCLVMLVLGAWTAAQPELTPTRYNVAVIDFEVVDIDEEVDPPASLGQALAVAFQTPIVSSRRFTLLTRQQLGAVLDELALGQSGVIDPTQAREMGNLSGADILITGNIVVYEAERFSVTANFIDVESGEIAAAPTFTVTTPQDFNRLAEQFVREALFEFPAQGRLLRVEGERAYINLGSNSGLSDAALTGTVYRNVDLGETTFQEMIGTVEVAQVSPDASLVTVLSGEPQVGDLVVMAPPEMQDVAETANDRGTGDQSANNQSTGDIALVVRGEPVGARLYLGDTFVGRLADGVYRGVVSEATTLRVEAEGYQSETVPIDPAPPQVEVQVGLEPLAIPRLGFVTSLISVITLLGAVVTLHIIQYRTRFAALGLHKHRPSGSTNQTYPV